MENMIKKEVINGKVFVEQTTYYVYEDVNHHQIDEPYVITSDEMEFNARKQIEKGRENGN